MGKFSNQSTVEYLVEANDALVTIAQIETKEALENVRCIDCKNVFQRFLTAPRSTRLPPSRALMFY